jgi:DNA-binding cell septation regulator SpoVG
MSNTELKVSEIEIVPVKPRGGLVAFAGFVVNEAFYVGDVGVHTRLRGDGIRLVYPRHTLPNGAKVCAFHPIRKDVATKIEEQVNEAYETLARRADLHRRRRSDDNERE